ncbi:MAG: 50S ribosomal protein L18 [Chloroflexi bacterium]|nr:50S ribosomal protein L18 [Chloroflexota bacterium]MDA1002588.1 50S ribosomal protein L18 [Chloroflexota bacterium]MQC27659.1 50S ribosomal protein L18 [Chloroflexota bacterium]
MAKHTTHVARLRRHHRVRRKVAGTPNRPRLAVFRSNQHIYAQVIDDAAGRTIVAASDAEADMRDGGGTKVQRAQAVGKRLAERSRQAGVDAVVFDRGGFRFAGRVKALADAAREEGLVF